MPRSAFRPRLLPAARALSLLAVLAAAPALAEEAGRGQTAQAAATQRGPEGRKLPADVTTEQAITLPDGRSVRLDSIARITDGAADPDQAALLDGKPVVGFEITRSRGAGEVAVADGVWLGRIPARGERDRFAAHRRRSRHRRPSRGRRGRRRSRLAWPAKRSGSGFPGRAGSARAAGRRGVWPAARRAAGWRGKSP